MRWILGLGNPGEEYRGTRHNVGSEVVARLSDRLHVSLRRQSQNFLASCLKTESAELLLIVPLTFMNASGDAVTEAQFRWPATPNDILVVLDDFQLPLGTLRIKPGGGDGGHNGLSSVLSALEQRDVPRLRIGIGTMETPVARTPEIMAEYVLSDFTARERPRVDEMISHAAAACESWWQEGIDAAMNAWNRDFFNNAEATQ